MGSWGVYPRLQEGRSGRAVAKGGEGFKKEKVLVGGARGMSQFPQKDIDISKPTDLSTMPLAKP